MTKSSEVTPDTPLHWLWCGTECKGAFIGPHLTVEDAELEKATSECDHDHMVFAMSLNQMVRSLRTRRRLAKWGDALYDEDAAHPLIRIAYYPLRSAELGRGALTLLVLMHRKDGAQCAV